MVETADGQRLADSQDIAFMETSAKSNVNISEAFSTMAQIILEKVGEGGEGSCFQVVQAFTCFLITMSCCGWVGVREEEPAGCVLCWCRTQRCSKGASSDRLPTTRPRSPALMEISQDAAARLRLHFELYRTLFFGT